MVPEGAPVVVAQAMQSSKGMGRMRQGRSPPRRYSRADSFRNELQTGQSPSIAPRPQRRSTDRKTAGIRDGNLALMTGEEMLVWSMSSAELLAAARDLVRRSQDVEADLLVHLAEIDER